MKILSSLKMKVILPVLAVDPVMRRVSIKVRTRTAPKAFFFNFVSSFKWFCVFRNFHLRNFLFFHPTDEEIERETALYLKELELLYGKKKNVPSAQSNESDDGLAKSEEEMRATMKRLEIEKKIEDRRLKKIKLEQEPPNLLFPDEKMLDLLGSDSSDGNETEEEEVEVTQPSKKIKLEDCAVGL